MNWTLWLDMTDVFVMAEKSVFNLSCCEEGKTLETQRLGSGWWISANVKYNLA